MTIECFLLFAAFVGTLLSAVWRVPLWIPVLLLCMAMLLNCLPLS
jgi:hypothetical protein